MSRKRIEKRLMAVSERLRELREEAQIATSQLGQVTDEADDARLRALVSEAPLDRHDHRDAQRAADTLARRQQRVQAKIAALEARQDELLEELTVQGS